MGRPSKRSLAYVLKREGRQDWTFDFGELRLRFSVAHALKRAMDAVYGHTEPASKYKVAIVLRRFAAFLHETGRATHHPLPTDSYQAYATWLAQSTLGPSAQAHVVITSNLLQWCARNAAGVLASRANLVAPLIRSAPRARAKRGLSESDVKTILQACYKAIGGIEEQKWKVRSLLSGRWETADELNLLLLVRDLVYTDGSGRLPPPSKITGSRLRYRLKNAGGLRKIADSIYISPQDILPYYLAILTQLSGNPEAVLAMDVDCVRPHPVRDDLERVVWRKWRAGSEQFVDFPVGKEWNAPDLINRLHALSVSLRLRHVSREDSKLFLRYNLPFRDVRLIELPKLHEELLRFAAAHSLPSFRFHELRGTGAQIVKRVRGSDLDAQRWLNHKSAATTQLYIRTVDADAEDNVLIHYHQQTLARLARSGGAAQDSTVQAASEPPAQAAETVFGFSCKDPLSGLAPGSTKGSACLQFSKCATCHGAFVTLDDWRVVARLLASSEGLNQARARAQAEGWWERYRKLYEPTRRIIDEVLLPAVSSVVLERAKPLVRDMSVPYLE